MTGDMLRLCQEQSSLLDVTADVSMRYLHYAQ